jgi:hypothetical protein
MNVSKDQKGNVGLWVVVLVAGLVLGFTAGKVTTHSKTTKAAATTTTGVTAKAADLRSTLVRMGLEHMTLTNQAVDAALDGSKTADASGAALYANGNEIGAAVGSVYGADAEKTFDAVWKLHLDQFVKYAVASSKGDEAGKTAALDAISTGYTKPLSQYLAKANPNLPEATLEQVLSEHVADTAQMIDFHVQGKYTDEFAELATANKHIETIFSTLAGGIVAQYPEKF